MNDFYFIGVDVSKKKLDFCVLHENRIIIEAEVTNHQVAIMAFIGNLESEFGIDVGDILVCAEHTGQYTYPLACACDTIKCKLWIENPSNIKYSSGIQRGKNDKIDAHRIATYAMRFADKARYYSLPNVEIVRLRQLEAERSLYVTDLAKYKAQLNDQKEYMPEKIFKIKAKRLSILIKSFEDAIKIITNEIELVISTTPKLARQYELLQSIDGVGPTVALNMIVITEAFTRFDNARQFNCYAGLAPFQYTSGSSLHSKARVSHRANKSIKTLLHLSAVSLLSKAGGEMKQYYLRKVEEGKSKMSVINALRAKIVARMFAVIRKNEFYKPILA